MRKLAIGALSICIGLLAACKNSEKPDAISFQDTGGVDSAPTCNVLTQTGCDPGQKCTWFIDQDGSNGNPDIGHIGCAADGTVALGGACQYGTGGSNATGDDNCETGDVCIGGVCKQICSETGSPACDATHACQTYYGFLGPPNMEAGGVCDPVCDPLTDNDFLDGSGVSPPKTGIVCGKTEGCFPGFSGGSGAPTAWTCAGAPNTTLDHRSMCTSANGCATPDGANAYKNGCAQGYIPYIKDDQTGVNTFVCIAVCAPQDCYMGITGTTNCMATKDPGATGHGCNATDANGTFATSDQCIYSWWFEQDTDGVLLSKTSNTVGLCLDHTLLHFTGTSGTTSDGTAFPACGALPITTADNDANCAFTNAGSADCGGVEFGCVSTDTGMVTTQFGRRHRPAGLPQLRHPYMTSARLVK